MNERQRLALDEAANAIDSYQASATRWRESWEALVQRVAELYHRARKKPEGQRVVTVLELRNLLNAETLAAAEPGESEEPG